MDYLFEVSKVTSDITEQNAYFDVLKALNNSKDMLSKDFITAVENQVKCYVPSILQFVDEDSAPVNVSTLSIVNDEVFDDWLADTATIDSVELRNKAVFY